MRKDENRCLLRTIAYHKTPPSNLPSRHIGHQNAKNAQNDIEGKITERLNIDELLTVRGITALTVPDNAISQVSEQLSHQCEVVQGAIVFHCSGVHSSEALSALKAKGAFTASIHPAFSFGDPLTSANSFPGAVCTYEGDQEALSVLLPVFERFGATLIPIDTKLKATYHAGCCVASNYLVGLYALSENILASAGVPRNAIPSILNPLMQSTINNLSHKPPSEALSGPIARNDTYTVELHTQNLSDKYACHYNYLGNLLIDQIGLVHREEMKKILTPMNLSSRVP